MTDLLEPTAIVGNASLFHADCRDVLRSLAANSIDSVVTDPPYALVSIQKRFANSPRSETTENQANQYGRTGRGFMGKKWDNGETAFSEEFWDEVLRVLKPGGHVVAFSGTRTYHRMAVAIEYAGFEIRDQLGWVYGSGFPKSHAVDLGLWKGVLSCQSKECAPLVVQISAFSLLNFEGEKELIAAAPALILPEGAPALIMATGKGGDSSEVTVMSLSASAAESISLNTGWSWERNLADNSDPRSMYTTETNSKQITTPEIWKSLTSSITQRSTPHSETLKNGWMWPAIIVASNSSEGEQSSGVIPILTALDCATWNPVAQAKGGGTALKPSWEPICLARKPLAGTVAENVLEWGTGAINVDGCRVNSGAVEKHVRTSTITDASAMAGLSTGSTGSGEYLAGRWPANIVHDGSDEVLACFPDAPGQQRSVGPEHGEKLSKGVYGDFGAREHFAPRQDSTKSAARFFYCAKASRKDRDEGMDGFVKKEAAAMAGNLVSGQRLAGDGTPIATPVRANTHPTVKPTSLMQWLCRLVTPPGGTILDPFMGSGSTGKAALLEGFRFIGCEREDEYMPIAQARIAAALRPTPKTVANDNAQQPQPQQADLFTEAA